MFDEAMMEAAKGDRLSLEQKAEMGLIPVPDSFFTDENRRLPEGCTMIRALDHRCPRCGGDVPTTMHRGLYPGGLSRTDNLHEVCSACSNAEGLEDYFGNGMMPQGAWRYPPKGPGANTGAGKSSSNGAS